MLHEQLQPGAAAARVQLPAQRTLRLFAAAPRILQHPPRLERGQRAVDDGAAVGEIDPHRAARLLLDAARRQPLRHRRGLGEHGPDRVRLMLEVAREVALEAGVGAPDAPDRKQHGAHCRISWRKVDSCNPNAAGAH